jgi:hypothetical protein
MVFGPAEDTTQDVEITIDRKTPAGKTKTYTVTVTIKVKRKIGTANCV